jgi:hypothetical protein
MTTTESAGDTLNDAMAKAKPKVENDLADLLRSYRMYQSVIDAAKREQDNIKTKIDAMHTLGAIGDTVEIDGIVAQIRSRRSWLYSSAIKKLQQKEQLDGTATPQEKHSWYIYQRQDNPTPPS